MSSGRSPGPVLALGSPPPPFPSCFFDRRQRQFGLAAGFLAAAARDLSPSLLLAPAWPCGP